MNPLKKLIRTLASQGITSGRVIATTSTTVSIVTKGGVQVIPNTATLTYLVGDEVAVKDGGIVGKLRRPDTLPVYRV